MQLGAGLFEERVLTPCILTITSKLTAAPAISSARTQLGYGALCPIFLAVLRDAQEYAFADRNPQYTPFKLIPAHQIYGLKALHFPCLTLQSR